MSFKVSRLVVLIKPGFLTGIERCVLLKLADYAGDDGSSIYPSLKRVSTETDFCLTAVKKAIKSLISKKVLVVVKSFTSRMPNIYRIDVESVKNLERRTIPNGKVLSFQEESPSSIRVSSGTYQGGARHHPNDLDLSRESLDDALGDARRLPRGSLDDTKPINNQSIEPITLLSVSSKRPVANAPLETHFSDHDCLEEIPPTRNTDQEEISLFPPRGCVEGLSSQLQNSGLREENSKQGFGVGFSYAVSFGRLSTSPFEGRFSSVLGKPSKTGLISGSECQSLVSIGNSQKTSPDHPNGPAIDMLCEKRDSDSKKVSSRKEPKKETRGTRIDETMVLDKGKLDIALNQGVHGSWVVSEFEEFVRYYANPNLAPSKAFHMNWEATWRNWCKNAILYDRYEKKIKPHPIVSAPSFSSSAESSLSPSLDSRLQAFVTGHHQLGSNAFAFQACEVVDHTDKVILQVPSRLYLDKVDLYHRELEDHFGKRVEMVIKPPQSQIVEEKPVITLSEADFLEPRFKVFLEKNIQIDVGVHFAFKATRIIETVDTVILHNDSAYGLSKVDFYAGDLEQFFGKRVEVESKALPRFQHPEYEDTNEVSSVEDDAAPPLSSKDIVRAIPRVLCKGSSHPFKNKNRINTFPYRSTGTVLKEERKRGVGS